MAILCLWIFIALAVIFVIMNIVLLGPTKENRSMKAYANEREQRAEERRQYEKDHPEIYPPKNLSDYMEAGRKDPTNWDWDGNYHPPR